MTPICYAVLVTYRPEPETLEATLRSLAPQVNGLIVIDNSPPEEAGGVRSVTEASLDGVGGAFEFIANNANIGIAAAQNIGIDRALELGTDYVIFSDHDTVFPPETVTTLVAKYQEKTAEGVKVGAVGPTYVNSHQTDEEPFFVVHKGVRFHKVFAKGKTVEATTLIASGMVASAEALREVGGFRAAFFIDLVDHEWCMRARSKGYRIFGCDEVRLLHRLGDEVIEFRGKTYAVHSPFRHYYMVRNTVWLARLPYSGSYLIRLKYVYIALQMLAKFPIVFTPHMAHFKACWRGFFHGFGRMRG